MLHAPFPLQEIPSIARWKGQGLSLLLLLGVGCKPSDGENNSYSSSPFTPPPLNPQEFQ
ncbi:hypothetical protein [Hyalangium versicolor]|uniref:hypothetical protein n=1 Tax=Hyalangium versicolor TaxID=2861190 RepID=UPI001CCF35BB|nr:hypothetical protein [Hyalangium versicolor]